MAENLAARCFAIECLKNNLGKILGEKNDTQLTFLLFCKHAHMCTSESSKLSMLYFQYKVQAWLPIFFLKVVGAFFFIFSLWNRALRLGCTKKRRSYFFLPLWWNFFCETYSPSLPSSEIIAGKFETWRTEQKKEIIYCNHQRTTEFSGSNCKQTHERNWHLHSWIDLSALGHVWGLIR